MYPVINKAETGIRLRLLMYLKGITVKEIQRYLSLACVQSVYHWLEGKSIPTVDNLYALSGLFQVPMDVMICGNRKWQRTDCCLEWALKVRMLDYYMRVREMLN